MTIQSANPQTKQNSLFSGINLVILGVVVALMVASFLMGTGIGFGLGRWTGPNFQTQRLDPGPQSLPRQPGATDDSGESTPRVLPNSAEDYALFYEAMELLYRDFYGELPDVNGANYAAIRGVLNQLEDPNTSFLTPQEAEFFSTRMEGAFEGIGAQVAWDDERKVVKIVEPYENQPAWNAGLRRGDLILAIDGEDVSDLDLTQAVMKIRGPQGTEVVLTIERDGGAAFEVGIIRDRIEIPIISTDMLGTAEDIGYVKLTDFSMDSGRLVQQAVEDVLDQGATSLIFDLRGNPGGLLREAINVTSVFQEEGVVAIQRYSDGREEIYDAKGSAIDGDIPIVVLINQSSASASEIVAGSLQDMGRAVLLGTTSYGKGSVQLPHQLSDGSVLRVTISKWYTPKNRSISDLGLEPDIFVELTEEDITADLDPQLDRALELLETGQ